VADGDFIGRPVTILVDSAQLESGEGMSDEFKRLAATEIAEFKAEYLARFPGRDAEELTEDRERPLTTNAARRLRREHGDRPAQDFGFLDLSVCPDGYRSRSYYPAYTDR
jgi:hypothetical protein